MINEPEEIQADPNKCLHTFKKDLADSRNAKGTIENQIITWINLWEGSIEGGIADGRSRIVHKEVEKQGMTFVANAISPFINTKDVVRLNPTGASDFIQASMMEEILNFQFKRKFNGVGFIRDAIYQAIKEGTSCAKIGWSIKQDYDTYEEFVDNGEGEVEKVVTKVPRTIDSRPTAELVKIEDMFVDPSATNPEEAQYFIHKMTMTMSELRSLDTKYNPNGIYKDTDSIVIARDDNKSSLESYRYTQQNVNGMSTTKDYEDNPRKKVTVYEYWGNYDLDGSGIAEPCVCTWVGNTVIRLEENPMPDKKPPFSFFQFYKDPTKFWGFALAHINGNHQRVITAITRGLIENLAYSNNNMYAVKKGALDQVNRRLLERAKPNTVIEFNSNTAAEAIQPLQPLPVAPQVFSMYEMFKQEAEMVTGISKNMQGAQLSSYSTATESQITSGYGEKRMIEIMTRFVDSFLRPIIKKWIKLNEVYLDPKDIERITDAQGFQGWQLEADIDVDISVALSGLDGVKAQQITALVQAISPMVQSGQAPADIITKLISKQCDIWGFEDIAKELLTFQPKPDPAQQAQQQMEMQKAQADIEASKAQAQLAYSKAQSNQALDAHRNEKLAVDTAQKDAQLAHQQDQLQTKAQIDVIKMAHDHTQQS